MLKVGDLGRREDHRVRGGQNRENPTRSVDISHVCSRPVNYSDSGKIFLKLGNFGKLGKHLPF